VAEETEGKKKGGFKRFVKVTALLAAIAGAIMFWKRRKGEDLDDVEWQELPPPAGG
jgi:hypothetical protein